MKLSHKISKLVSRESYVRSGRKLRRRLFPIPLNPLLAKIDPERLAEIRARYSSSNENYAKYVDVERWLKRHIKRVQDLDLHRTKPQDILDLGCGGGFFLFIAQHYGHSGIGLDIDEFPLLEELMALLNVRRKVWTIRPFESLPDLERKFDWITAFSTRFNRDAADQRIWSVEEWNFFLDDLSNHLNPGGKVFLEINSGKTKRFYPEEVRDLFLLRGAKLERENVFFAKGVAR